jgi:hypothetical protein
MVGLRWNQGPFEMKAFEFKSLLSERTEVTLPV